MNKQTSEYISDFLSFCDFATKGFNAATEAVGQADKATCDYLHQIELGEYKDRAKTTTALAKNLRIRRENKDVVETLSPIVEWINKNQGAINTLKNVLGVVRKKERSTERYYYPRVVMDLEISKKNGVK